MMKYLCFFLFTFFFLNTTVAQHHNVKNSKSSSGHDKSYISLDDYKQFFKKTPDFKDTSSYMVIQGDTLIAIDSRKKKSVPFEYKDDVFLNLYKKIAFNDNHKSKDGKSRLKYWKSGINVYFSKSIPAQSQKNLKKFAKEISEGIDSLNISFVTDINKANYIVYCSGDFEYASNIEKSEADFSINWNGKNQITKGFLKIDRTTYFNETLMNEKMQQLFIESLGYFRTTDKLDCHSYFSKCYDSKKVFGLLDKEILKYHYSYGICKGIDEETFDGLHENAKNHKKNHPDMPFMMIHIEP
ncbi:hypothetical protein FLJC2902T_15640 [Flavobacterium limnosediminis JC2902]|uniref:Uncharacterized protein n=1 Tax=Flavobacterium limnosediminis JC2902 TaxID=1341181 RepID=V6SNF5_9FLAO|nr:DUF2927 domain-containing protein [Flavobacterium limnosediminis]ESU28218.1 hypothetical protein FLJC2902T_15640 [Flavobacterium limnosediminis JC2902]